MATSADADGISEVSCSVSALHATIGGQTLSKHSFFLKGKSVPIASLIQQL